MSICAGTIFNHIALTSSTLNELAAEHVIAICELRVKRSREQEAISIYLPINELLNEIASSAFGPPRNDATTLTTRNVIEYESTPSVIAYILPAARLGTRNDANTLTIRDVAYGASVPSVIFYILPALTG